MKHQVFNPFLPLNEYIPDGEPHVFGNRLYLFGSHDKEGGNEYCEEGNYVGWSAPLNDLSDWRCEGEIFSGNDNPDKGGAFLYAPDVVRGNDGKYYLYYCMNGFTPRINVAVCDKPCGRYKYLGFVKNADGTPLTRFIPGDPAVINDDGVIRLYYGWSLSLVAAQAHTGQAAQASQSSEQMKEGIISAEMMMFKRTRDEITGEEGGSIMGAVACVLDYDMLTVKVQPKRIVPGQFMADGTGFENHAFYEASSIRKINGKYYFIYSSMQSNELCYAISDYPDRDFKYGGTIISNGDVGFNGRKAEDRLNMTANNHGSLECVNGVWYIFYHRQTHGSAFSRQACAERVEIADDGSIKQVECTSCGLNGKPLKAEGKYHAGVYCNLTNGKMPHVTNRKVDEPIPQFTNDGDERFIKNITDGTLIAFKYFDFEGKYDLTLTVRGECSGKFEILDGKNIVGEITVEKSMEWKNYQTTVLLNGVKPLEYVYYGNGNAQLLSFEIKQL